MSEPFDDIAADDPWPCSIKEYAAWIAKREPMPPLTNEQIVKLGELFGPAIRTVGRGAARRKAG